MDITYSALSDKGLKREENQDRITAHAKDGYALFAVADGMGGHSDGAFASTEIITDLDEFWLNSSRHDSEESFMDYTNSLRESVNYINRKIYNYSKSKNIICGSTLSLVSVYNGNYIALNIGDSPILTLTKKNKEQLSVAHDYSNVMKKSGAEDYISSEKLVQALGVKEQIYPFVRTGSVAEEQVFLICSDGISKYSDNKQLFKLLKKIFSGKLKTDEALNQLKNTAYKNGASDNLSAIIFIIKSN